MACNIESGRHLAAEPITAYQMRKFVRRHKALVAGAAAVFLALVFGVVASTREAVRAHKAELAAEEQRRRADQEATAARAVVDFLQNDLRDLPALAESPEAGPPRARVDRRTARDPGPQR